MSGLSEEERRESEARRVGVFVVEREISQGRSQSPGGSHAARPLHLLTESKLLVLVQAANHRTAAVVQLIVCFETANCVRGYCFSPILRAS